MVSNYLNEKEIKKVLVFGGLDPSGGAGILLDSLVLLNFGVFPYVVATALTSQNSQRVNQIKVVSPQIIKSQINTIIEDITQVNALKIGLLGSVGVGKVILKAIIRYKLEKIVCDPVIFASDGTRLLEKEGEEFLIKSIIPLSYVVTYNFKEVEIVTGIYPKSLDEAKEAAIELIKLGSPYVLIKGGHFEGEAIDLLFNGKKFIELSSPRVSKEVRGTGCAFSSALAAGLAQGLSMVESFKRAKKYVEKEIRKARQIGKGRCQIVM